MHCPNSRLLLTLGCALALTGAGVAIEQVEAPPVLSSGFQGRFGATKEKLVKSNGGNNESERAVALGLAWLAKQQHKDGYWEFDGKRKDDRVAATGLCLLPFLAAGETHKVSRRYKSCIARGMEFLRSQRGKDGQIGSSGLFAHALATTAICEAFGMTQDRELLSAAKQAVDFIVKSQGKDGSWGETPGKEGNTMMVGMNVEALKCARLAAIDVPDEAFKQAEKFLNSVSKDSGASYAGQVGEAPSPMHSSIGLLCRQFMGWSPRSPSLGRGVNSLVLKYLPQKDKIDVYYFHYATQVVYFIGGADWEVKWNPVMRDMLVGLQVTEKVPNAQAADVGSWAADKGFVGTECGKLGTTAYAVLTLEVYYRYPPLYKRDAGGGIIELEK